MATRNYQGKKFNNSTIDKIVDALTIEEALQININNKPFTVSMRTPGNDIELVRGLLHAEGVINNVDFIPEISLKKENDNGIVTIVNVNIPEKELGEGYSNSRSLLSVSSCGICGKTELSDLAFIGKTIDDNNKIDIGLIHSLFNKMNNFQYDFRESGGTHAAAAFTLNGKLLCAMEDIGRHNAVDKIVGKLINNQELNDAKIMTVSGRISYEIVIKCFKARIPFLAAVSAPSSLAVDYAKELGITLFAFCRDQRATCYSNPQRTKIQSTNTKAS
ncbi:formate dehydrogenase accessory sulfurtransferase FdhD [Flavobacteriaceae bacterium S0825]|uniref:formate dehydrogenase accessory sulfurtransferase FdhD n=1 Tax=Gaetbulibacter sp. S0825 TaxID=2720084 RepID=UPI0014309AC0|nr:formate dehydrogenase accessory sulfurtransferase FdhD [Gaetbulibacter sp. S0825]MCK0108698.1 formate dehydrogenase accessory sulfurtransferase FdhD [Flavobacteriaceae bacterium S0825]NIX64334.1 formate dehydrogenase accessory sulfurtransferase FdhD [Gaetbulibacter sp. S0825]